jgi:hypothetical protein
MLQEEQYTTLKYTLMIGQQNLPSQHIIKGSGFINLFVRYLAICC